MLSPYLSADRVAPIHGTKIIQILQMIIDKFQLSELSVSSKSVYLYYLKIIIRLDYRIIVDNYSKDLIEKMLVIINVSQIPFLDEETKFYHLVFLKKFIIQTDISSSEQFIIILRNQVEYLNDYIKNFAKILQQQIDYQSKDLEEIGAASPLNPGRYLPIRNFSRLLELNSMQILFEILNFLVYF